jgi:hypothetical protein
VVVLGVSHVRLILHVVLWCVTPCNLERVHSASVSEERFGLPCLPNMKVGAVGVSETTVRLIQDFCCHPQHSQTSSCRHFLYLIVKLVREFVVFIVR